jgi:hypothetical protein
VIYVEIHSFLILAYFSCLFNRPKGRGIKPQEIKKTELNSDDALRIVSLLKECSLIDFTIVKAGNGTVLFSEFLKTFWDFGTSPYVREKLATGTVSADATVTICLTGLRTTVSPLSKTKP